MIRTALFCKEWRGCIRPLACIAAILTLYITLIVGMFDPDMAQVLRQFEALMPELMAAVGMAGVSDTLLGFLESYLYGFLLLLFPLLYTILRANALVAGYVDRGSMASLLAAPVRRRTVVLTQMAVLYSSLLALLLYCALLEYATAQILFPGALDAAAFWRLNGGLACLQLCLAAFCLLCSCAFDDTRRSLACGAGVPVCMYVLQMLVNQGGRLENFKYFTVFTLFDAAGLGAGEAAAAAGALVLLAAAVLLSVLAAAVFCRRDLHL